MRRSTSARPTSSCGRSSTSRDRSPSSTAASGLRLWFERLRELWAFVEVQEVQIAEHNGGWVLMDVSARVRGRGSPHEFEPRVAVAVRVAAGRITKFGLFPDHADAVAMIDAS